ncbi:MAG: hypothetical protein GY851_09180, partial [bacterium]|nr:hypothetical protein [bacterium]
IGGDSIDWKLAYAGNSGFLYNEDDSLPAAGNVTYADMTVSHFHAGNVVRVTGHLRDAINNGYFDAIRAEMEAGISGLIHKVEEKLVTLFEAAINDDASYGGKTRSTVHADSDVTAGGSAAMTLAMLSEMYETQQLDPRATVYDPRDHIIISSPEQQTAYTEVATGTIVTGDAEAAGANLPYGTQQTDASLDAGLMKHAMFYNGIPWVAVPTITNTLVFLTRRSDIIIEEARPVTIEPLGKIDDSDRFLISWAGGLAHLDPYRASRIEALTT